jgi:hypothetical protein
MAHHMPGTWHIGCATRAWERIHASSRRSPGRAPSAAGLPPDGSACLRRPLWASAHGRRGAGTARRRGAPRGTGHQFAGQRRKAGAGWEHSGGGGRREGYRAAHVVRRARAGRAAIAATSSRPPDRAATAEFGRQEGTDNRSCPAICPPTSAGSARSRSSATTVDGGRPQQRRCWHSWGGAVARTARAARAVHGARRPGQTGPLLHCPRPRLDPHRRRTCCRRRGRSSKPQIPGASRRFRAQRGPQAAMRMRPERGSPPSSTVPLLG